MFVSDVYSFDSVFLQFCGRVPVPKSLLSVIVTQVWEPAVPERWELSGVGEVRSRCDRHLIFVWTRKVKCYTNTFPDSKSDTFKTLTFGDPLAGKEGSHSHKGHDVRDILTTLCAVVTLRWDI